MIELYKRQGRFAATVEPKMVSLDHNRVDVVFEINEGPKSKVRQINNIGNEKFSDGDLKDDMANTESGLLTNLSRDDGCVGKTGASTVRSGWTPEHYTKKTH